MLDSDFRIAVSGKLVEYWQTKFGYHKNDHVVIPCTINSKMPKVVGMKSIHEKRIELGFSDDDTVFVYSGSSAGWQSLRLIDEFLCNIMKQNEKVKALFLTNGLVENMNVLKDYEGRGAVKWVRPNEVSEIISCCDYGLLIREDSVTNQVASPVKFAEYLLAGIKVLISANIGDYSNFVSMNDCGYVVRLHNTKADFHRLTIDERLHNTGIAQKYFLKDNYLKEYKELHRHLS